MKNGQSLNNILDFRDEKDFISYKINKRTNRRLVSKSITTTIKYEYKSLNDNIKNDKINNNKKKENCSSILRTQSSIINNRPYDSLSKKIKANNEIKNYKSKREKKKYNKINEDKINFTTSNRGFENFSLSRVCGSSHPPPPQKQKEQKTNNEIDNINKNEIDNNYNFIKSYTLNYNYKKIYEETNSFINNKNNENNNCLDKTNVNKNEEKIENNIKFLRDKSEQDNVNNLSKTNSQNLFLLPESTEIKNKHNDKIKKSLSSSNINYYNYQKNNNDSLNNKTMSFNRLNKNKLIFNHQINNLKNTIIQNNKKHIFIPKEENKNENDKNYINKIKKNNINNLYNKYHEHKTYYFRNEFDIDKTIQNKRNINNKKINSKKNNKYINNYNNKIYNNNMYKNIIKDKNKIFLKKNSEYSTFNSKVNNFMKKYGNKEKVKCVMPANDLNNILSKNQVGIFEYF